MALRRDHLAIRVVGTALGLGFLGLGAFALWGAAGLADAAAGSRALGLGVTLVLVGVLAVAGSLTVTDPHGIW